MEYLLMREVNVYILYHPENIPGNQRFSGVFRGYKMVTIARNELKGYSHRKSNI